MTCRNCKTEIADKALICYRCGTATTEATFKPPARARGRSPLLGTVIVLVLLIIVVALVARTASGETPRTLSIVVVAGAIIVVAVRAYLRRR